MSLKLVPFESMDAVSYSPTVVTVAVSVAICEIFNVKEWRDLEDRVRGRSMSFKMAPFDNNNNNNNKHDDVYGAVIMADPLREFTRFI